MSRAPLGHSTVWYVHGWQTFALLDGEISAITVTSRDHGTCQPIGQAHHVRLPARSDRGPSLPRAIRLGERRGPGRCLFSGVPRLRLPKEREREKGVSMTGTPKGAGPHLRRDDPTVMNLNPPHGGSGRRRSSAPVEHAEAPADHVTIRQFRLGPDQGEGARRRLG